MKHLIKLWATTILALGFCAFVVVGCGKTSASKDAVTVAEMNQVMSRMSMSPVGAPKTVEELTNFAGFKGRPFSALPAGQKLAIDPTSHLVIIVNK